MNIEEPKTKQQFKQEELLTPKNIISMREDIPTKEDRFKDKNDVYESYDLRQNFFQNQQTIKKKIQNRDNSFLNNIKKQLASLKTQVQGVIKNDTDLQLPNKHKNNSRQLSQNHSDSSLESYDSRAFLRQTLLKSQVSETDNSSTLTDRRLKLYQQQNETLKQQVKKQKNKYRQYKQQAQQIMMLLHERLAQSQETISHQDQQLMSYKKQVQKQMITIKKMLQNAEGMSLRQSQVSTKTSSKVLQQQNTSLKSSIISLKSSLVLKQKQLNSQNVKIQTLSKQNQRLRQQLDHFQHHFQSSLSNATLFKCGQSHIQLQYSKSRCQHDQSKALFDLEDDMLDKQTINPQKVHLHKKQLQNLQSLTNQLRDEIEYLQQLNKQSTDKINSIEKQKISLINKVSILQAEIEQQKNTPKSNQTIKDLQDKIFKLINSLNEQSDQIQKLKLEFSKGNGNSNNNGQLSMGQMIEQLRYKVQQVESLRQAIRGLHNEVVLLRSNIDTLTNKFNQQKKHLVQQLDITRTNLRQQILRLEKANNSLLERNRQLQFNNQNNRAFQIQRPSYQSYMFPDSSSNTQRTVQYSYDNSNNSNIMTRRVSEQKVSRVVRQQVSHIKR